MPGHWGAAHKIVAPSGHGSEGRVGLVLVGRCLTQDIHLWPVRGGPVQHAGVIQECGFFKDLDGTL